MSGCGVIRGCLYLKEESHGSLWKVVWIVVWRLRVIDGAVVISFQHNRVLSMHCRKNNYLLLGGERGELDGRWNVGMGG